MTRFGRMQLSTTARALAAALAITGALVSLVPGPNAYAARGRSTGDGGAGTGDAPGRPTATAKETNINDHTKCSATHADGTIEFFVPLDTAVFGGKTHVCTTDGTWVQAGPPRPTPGVKVTGGGVYSPTP
jgi:hypothetical protein